ncbi:MAG: hypothetical protein M5U26_00305 [Planctomycetota bacterium]|nr:hypothetical protein [Planctomycetota bacterium]
MELGEPGQLPALRRRLHLVRAGKPPAHARPAGELAAAQALGQAGAKGEASGAEAVARERACLAYAQGMPGAVQFKLHAGDFALYRPIGWHIGNYVPYKKRATLHDAVFTPQYEAWWKAWRAGGSPRWAREVCAAT